MRTPWIPRNAKTDEAERIIDLDYDRQRARESELENEGRDGDRDWPEFIDEQDD